MQVAPVTHAAHVGPPQSTADSWPFLTPSMHVAAWHFAPWQIPLWQSAPAPQPWFTPQRAVQDPPQSTSVSAPFLTLSEQLGAWQSCPTQTLLEQSAGSTHAAPGVHGWQA